MFVHLVEENHAERLDGKNKFFRKAAPTKNNFAEFGSCIQTVEFEIDTTDYFAYKLADLLAFKYKISWNSYIYKEQ